MDERARDEHDTSEAPGDGRSDAPAASSGHEDGAEATPLGGQPPTPVAGRPAVARRGRAVFERTRRAASTRMSNWRSWLPRMRIGLFALAGAVIALALLGRVPAKLGPFDTTLAVRPSLAGQTVVHLAPLGNIELDTHDWPLALDLRVDEIGVAEAERIADNPASIRRLGDDVAEEARAALVGLVVRCVLVALAGGLAGALAARASWRSALAGVGVAALLVAGVGGGTAVTFNAGAVAEPRYTGLLTRAPTAVGDVQDVLDRFGEYRAQLGELVDNVATLYLAGEQLPTFTPDERMIRVLHVSDIHLNPQAFDLIRRLTDQFAVDVIADTGDLTDWGTDPEAALVGQIGRLEVPYVFVRGNHDSRSTAQAVATQPNAVVLDGAAATVAGLRFWGVGDPRYTPDKSQAVGGQSEKERAEAFAPQAANLLAADEPPDVDVALVHDQRTAADLGGEVPLVLAGHTHTAKQSRIEPQDNEGDRTDGDDESTSSSTSSPSAEDTLLLVEGSTGGAGLRGLQGEEPEPLTASVLYFDAETKRLVAYDRVTVAGLGGVGATIERHLVGGTRGAGTEGPGANGS
jgi:predicted phosphodiesterase